MPINEKHLDIRRHHSCYRSTEAADVIRKKRADGYLFGLMGKKSKGG